MNQFDLKNFTQTRNLMEYLKKKRENAKFNQYVEIGTTFLLITFFLIFAIRPTVLTISSLLGEIRSKEVLSRQMRAKINSVITAQDLFSRVQESYQVVNSCLPDQPRFSQASVQIFNIAKASSIPVSGINFTLRDEENRSPHLKSYAFTLSVPISFSQSQDFISRVQNNRRLFTVNSLSFAVPKGVEGSDAIQLSFSPRAYYWFQ